jgi:hypothetical protein
VRVLCNESTVHRRLFANNIVEPGEKKLLWFFMVVYYMQATQRETRKIRMTKEMFKFADNSQCF